MERALTSPLALASKADLTATVAEARDAIGASFERSCLIADLVSLAQVLEEDAMVLAGAPHTGGGQVGISTGPHPGPSGFSWR